MQAMIDFFRENASWLFGGGGVAAFVIALFKRGGGDKPGNLTVGEGARVGGDAVAGNKSVGLSGLDLALILAVVICGLGAVSWFAGPRQGNPVVINGNGNAVATGAGASATSVGQKPKP